MNFLRRTSGKIVVRWSAQSERLGFSPGSAGSRPCEEVAERLAEGVEVAGRRGRRSTSARRARSRRNARSPCPPRRRRAACRCAPGRCPARCAPRHDCQPFGLPSKNGELAKSAVAIGCSASDTRNFFTMSASEAKSRFTCTVQVRYIISGAVGADRAHVAGHQRVAALGHHRHLVLAPDRAAAEADEARAHVVGERLHLVEVLVHLVAGLVDGLERRAGELELAAGLEADVGAVLGQADELAAPPRPAPSHSARRGPTASRGSSSRPHRGGAAGRPGGSRTSRARCRSAIRPRACSRRPDSRRAARGSRSGRRLTGGSTWAVSLCCRCSGGSHSERPPTRQARRKAGRLAPGRPLSARLAAAEEVRVGVVEHHRPDTLPEEGAELDEGRAGADVVVPARPRQVGTSKLSRMRPGRGPISSTRSASRTASSTLWVTKTTTPRRARPDAHQLDLHQLAGLGVDAGEGLVHQQDLGLGRQRPGQRDALLHAAGELVRIGVGEAVEADERRGSARTRSPTLGRGDAVEVEAEADVVVDRRPGDQPEGLEDEADAAGRAAAARRRPGRSPASGASRPSISRSSVVLPQPLGPTRLTKLVAVDVERHVRRAPRPAPPRRRGGTTSRRRGGDHRTGRGARAVGVGPAARRSERGPVGLRARRPRSSSTPSRTERSTHSSSADACAGP